VADLMNSVTNSSLGRGINWWLDGLVDVLVWLSDRPRRGRDLKLTPTADGYSFVRSDRLLGARANLRLANGDTPHFKPERLARILRDRNVVLVLKPDEVLVRTLDPLPPDSRPFLDDIVRHNLERLTPWLPLDVLHGYAVERAGPSDPRLLVTVAATAHSIMDKTIAALKACAPRNIRLLYADAASSVGPISIPVGYDAEKEARRASIRLKVLAGLAIAGLAVLGTGIMLTAEWQAVENERAEVEQAITVIQRELGAGGGPGAELNAVLARKRETPPSVSILEELSERLPDDTFLTELRMADGRVRMVGVSSSVAALIPLLEETPGFTGTNFFAPTMRLPDGRGDRFHIDAHLQAPVAGPK